jgi:hypothetical protein
LKRLAISLVAASGVAAVLASDAPFGWIIVFVPALSMVPFVLQTPPDDWGLSLSALIGGSVPAGLANVSDGDSPDHIVFFLTAVYFVLLGAVPAAALIGLVKLLGLRER